jgi:uncharacterized delta-60 repeat protein
MVLVFLFSLGAEGIRAQSPVVGKKDDGGSNQTDGEITAVVAAAIPIQGYLTNASGFTLNGSYSLTSTDNIAPPSSNSLELAAVSKIVGDLTTEGDFTDTIRVRRIGSMGTAYPVDALAVAAHLSSMDAPDPGFGVGGGVVIDFGQIDDANAVAQQADGKILVAGMTKPESIWMDGSWYSFPSTAVVVRLMPDGSLDTTFGVGGVAKVKITSGDFVFYDLAIQPDGKIIAAGKTVGYITSNLLVARFNANGTLDTTFASNGVLDLDVGESGVALAVALQTDGKIVLGGQRDLRFFAARLLSNGDLDVTFDTDGIETISLGKYGTANDVAIQPDGKIVLAGTADRGNTYGNTDIGLVRLLADGTLDPTFDGDGKAILDLGTRATGYGAALEADGKIVVAGMMFTGVSRDAIVVRTTNSGGLDSTFDGDGVVSIDFGADLEQFDDVAIQPDGKIVVAGRSGDSGVENFIVGRLLPDGSLDPTFEGGGVIFDFGGRDYAHAVAVQADGKILVAGRTDSDWAILRLTATGTNTPPVSNAQSVSTAEDTAKAITLTAIDAEGNTLTYTVVAETSHGVLTGSSPNLTYTPAANYNGPDSFTFKANDGTVDSNIATVSITVTAVNDAPIITEGTSTSVTMSENGTPTPFSLTLYATDVDDGDTITWSISTPASHGTASASGTGTSKSIFYIPDLDYHGSDIFVVRVSDGFGGTDTITVNVTINAGESPSFTVFLPLILR